MNARSPIPLRPDYDAAREAAVMAFARQAITRTSLPAASASADGSAATGRASAGAGGRAADQPPGDLSTP
jgi:hypothetical protein